MSFVTTLIIVSIVIFPLCDAVNAAGNVDNPDAQLENMHPVEREFCENILWQINSSSTERDVLALLGQPSRDRKYKKNWWVELGGKRDRVGVYFNLQGFATEVVLDGGIGRFYYRRKVTEHEHAPHQPSRQEGDTNDTAPPIEELLHHITVYKNQSEGIAIHFPNNWDILDQLKTNIVGFRSPEQNTLIMVGKEILPSPLSVQEYATMSIKQVVQRYGKESIQESRPDTLLETEGHRVVFLRPEGKCIQICTIVENTHAYILTFLATDVAGYNAYNDTFSMMKDSLRLLE